MGLGSNQSGPVAQLSRAIQALACIPDTRVLACSGLYANPPMGPADQPDFVNAVVEIATPLEPMELLDALQAIERAQGRVHGSHRWGPRTVDLDLLLYGSRCVRQERLQLPHPGLSRRAFVLHPLAEIALWLPIPGHGHAGELARKVSAADLRRLDVPPPLGPGLDAGIAG